MAISFVNSSTANAAAGSPLSIPTPASIAQDDVLVAFLGRNSTAALTVTSTGWTQLVGLSHSVGSLRIEVWLKVMGASPDTSFDVSDTTDGAKLGAIGAYRGVDTTTPTDATTTTSEGLAGTSPDNPAITTVTDHAWVLACAVASVNDATVTNPTGYSNQHGGARIGVTGWGATKDVSPAGSEDPAGWGSWTTAANLCATVALRPSGAAATPFKSTLFPDSVRGANNNQRGHTNSLALNLYGKDQFFGAPGETKTYDYPNPRAPVRSIELRTHIDRLKLNLLGKDQFFGAPGQVPTYDWQLPQRPRRASDLQTWLNTFVPPATQAPFKTADFANPRRQKIASDGWVSTLPPGTLLPPFRPQIYPEFQRAKQSQVWVAPNLLQNLLNRPFLPILWENPTRTRPQPQFWSLNLQQTTLQPIPFKAIEWRVPSPKSRGDNSWTINLLLNTLAVVTVPPVTVTTGPIRADVSVTGAKARVATSPVHGDVSTLGATAKVKGSGARANVSAASAKSKITVQ